MWLAWFRGYDEAAQTYARTMDEAFCRHNSAICVKQSNDEQKGE
jgi:hypothetical protein